MTCGNENPDDVEALFPADALPENRIGAVSSLCSFGMRPHVMTGFLKQLLLQHYCDAENLEEIILRTRFRDVGAWLPSERTGIYIESITQWRPELAEKRPALVIKRNGWRWERHIIGEHADTEWEEGAQFFVGFWFGSHTIFAIGSKPAETELLATETVNTILQYGQLITDQMGLHRFVPVEIGGIAALEESRQHYVVPLTFAYAAEESWKLETHAPRLKRIQFRRSDLF